MRRCRALDRTSDQVYRTTGQYSTSKCGGKCTSRPLAGQQQAERLSTCWSGYRSHGKACHVVDASDAGHQCALPGGLRDLVLLCRGELPESIDTVLHLINVHRYPQPLQQQRALLVLPGVLLGRLRSRVILSSRVNLSRRSLALRSVGRCRMGVDQPHR